MANHFPYLLLLLSITISLQPKPVAPTPLSSPYLSPSLFTLNYQKMLQTFKIFIYSPQTPSFNTPIESLFHTSLLKSPFITTNGNEAHLFYLYFPPNSSYKSISRIIKDIRVEFPFWNRTLGADHFYVLGNGIGHESDRNLVELKKNSVQISCFLLIDGQSRFIPHKDISLPALIEFNSATIQISRKTYLGYISNQRSDLIEELRNDPDFLIESESSDDGLTSSKFCLFFYGGDVSDIGKALRYGCVPVVITDRPIRDMPFMDVLRWNEIALFVGGVKEAKNVLSRTCGEKYEKMREMGMLASKHFVWNTNSQPYDAFHAVLYQLWLRRHTIRYARRGVM